MFDNFPWVTLALVLAISYGAKNLYNQQERLLYFPLVPGLNTRYIEDNPAPYNLPPDASPWGMQYEDFKFEAADGIKLHGWLIKAGYRKNGFTIIFFHSNAGNMALRLPIIREFHDRGFNVFIFDYRGYGASELGPEGIHERGIIADLEYVDRLVRAHPSVKENRIIAYGQSLGGAIAIQYALRYKVAGLIIENTFKSIPSIASDMFSINVKWINYFCRMKWMSIDHIAQVKVPILFFSSSEDEVVPPSHMIALYNAATLCKKKTMVKVDGAKHNDCFYVAGTSYFDNVENFAKSLSD